MASSAALSKLSHCKCTAFIFVTRRCFGTQKSLHHFFPGNSVLYSWLFLHELKIRLWKTLKEDVISCTAARMLFHMTLALE